MATVAVYGDASAYHVDCARKVYGATAIDAITGENGVELAFTDEWPKDREGNDLTISYDVPLDTSCDVCLSLIHDDVCTTRMADMWPDYEGMEECPKCEADVSSQEDMSSCQACGYEDLWQHGYPACDNCGQHITSGTMYSVDGPYDYCQACASVVC